MNNKIIDCHMHYLCNIDEIRDCVERSKYKDIYLGYSSIDYDHLDIANHLNICDGGFIMPYCFKETNINDANRKLFSFSKCFNKRNFYFLPFINNDIDEFMVYDGTIGLKEHFYIHDSFRYYERIKAYQYLNDYKKLLIIHCDNSIRIDYVKYLAEQYPQMLIQVAHLGIFRNSKTASKLVIDELTDCKNVFFDISTVFDKEIIQLAVKKIPERILYGTDIPYVSPNNCVEKYDNLLKDCNLSVKQTENVLYNNATVLIERLL